MTDQTSAKPGPLSGLRVLELAHVMAGPACGRMLADLGADVIKLERPGGEDSRHMAPPWLGTDSAAYVMMNRNKRDICIDLKTPEGKRAFLDLAKSADVVIENFRKGTMERLGIGYDTVKALNPKIIYCATIGVLAALNERQRSGLGQRVDTSLYEAALFQTLWQSAIYLADGGVPQAMGSAHPLDGPYQAFETADRWIVIGAANQANWLRLVKVITAER